LYAEHIAHLLDNPQQAALMGHRGAARAQRYT
jgi:hypothetical protein